MKKLVGLFFAAFCVFFSQAQTITDSGVLRSNINTYIVPNSAGGITAARLNSILNGHLNVMQRLKVDSVWIAGDSLRVLKFGVTRSYALPAGGGGGSYTNGYGLLLASSEFAVDTNLITTKAWLYKVADSLAAISGSALRFGYPGEDETRTVNGAIDFNMYNFTFNNLDYLRLNSDYGQYFYADKTGFTAGADSYYGSLRYINDESRIFSYNNVKASNDWEIGPGLFKTANGASYFQSSFEFDATTVDKTYRLADYPVGVSQYIPLSVNNVYAGTDGNISLSIGSVTSVATGLGLSGGPITTTGTVVLDTASTVVLSRQRAAATYQPIGSYLNVSDTAAMLIPYQRSAAATAAIALKLSIADTASMLSVYERAAHAAATYATITNLATKVNISDTGSMLSPYLLNANANVTFGTKQATLVSGTNIKSVNGSSLLGSGNLAVGDALVANPLSQFAATTSTELAGVLTNETGTGNVVYSTSPTLVTPDIGTPTAAVLTNATGLPLTTGVTGVLGYANGGTNVTTSNDLYSNYALSFRRNNGYDYFGEFTNPVATAATANELIATNSGTGAGNSIVNSTDRSRPGIIRLTTGTTATGRACISTNGSAIGFGGGKWIWEEDINITQLSDGTNRFQLLAGFFDTYTTVNQIDAAYFLYDEGGVTTGSAASANWQLVTSNNSTRTFTTTSTAITTAAGYVKLRIEVNAAGTSVDYFINGSNVGTITTNIPTAGARVTGYGQLLIKSVGTTAVTMDTDTMLANCIYTTPR